MWLILADVPAYGALHMRVATIDTTMRTNNGTKAKAHTDGQWLAPAALGSGLLGLAVGAVIFGSAAIVFGILSLCKKRRNQALAAAGIVLGVFDVVIGILIIATLL